MLHPYEELREKLQETNARLAAIVESSDDAIIGKDLNGIITSWNRGAERMYGYTEAEAVGRPISMLAPPEFAGEIARILEDVKRGEILRQIETERVRKDGRRLNLSLTISPIRNAAGTLIGSSTIGRDITSRKKSEEIIRRQADILNQIRDSVITTDLDGYITSWNGGAVDMFSYTEAEALGKHVSMLYPEDQVRVLEEEIIAPLKERGACEREVFLKRKSGDTFVAILLLRLMKNGKGDVIGMVGSSVDISERKKAEEEIKRAKDEWEQTFDALPDAVAVIDNHHVIRRANKALASKLGVDRQELLGTLCYQSMCGLEHPLPACPGTLALTTRNEQIEERYIDQMNGHYLISCTPVFGADGSVTSSVEVCRDITERKKMEKKLQDAAITDELTGLLNRRGFLSMAEHELNLAKRDNRSVALLYLDLNKMKEINDKHGHKEGDRALIDAANVLRKTFRESDVIARLGGDEFAVLLEKPPTTDIEQAVSAHLQRNVRSFNALSERPYRLSLSAGIAYYDSVSRHSLDDLISTADGLMYAQKQRYIHDREVESSIEEGWKHQRLYDRFVVDERWSAEIEEFGLLAIKNISPRGICVETRQRVDVGRRHRITIHTPDRDISNEVVGIWCRPSEARNESGVPSYEFGMKILNSDQASPLPL